MLRLTPDVNGLPHPLAKTKHILQYVRDTNSTYIHEPPYFKGMTMDPPGPHGVKDAYCLLNFGDSITTDHISPAGNINRDSPAHSTPHHLAKASNLPSNNKLQHTITSQATMQSSTTTCNSKLAQANQFRTRNKVCCRIEQQRVQVFLPTPRLSGE